MAKIGSDTSVLGASTQVSGRISGEGGLRIEGKLSGDVVVSGLLEIAAGAAVEGDVNAAALEIAGKLEGDGACRGAIMVRSGASVRGDLKGSSIAIEPGARVDVRLDTEFDLDLGRR